MKIINAMKIIPTCENFKRDFTIYALLTVIVTVLNYISQSGLIKDQVLLLTSAIVIFVCALLTCGYYLITLRNYMLHKPNFLPKWFDKHDIKEISIAAFKYMLAVFLCIIVVAIWNMTGLFLIKKNQFATTAFITLAVANITFFISLLIFLPAITIEFCTNLKFRAFFNFKQAFSIIQTAGWNYYRSVGIILGINIIITILYNYSKNILLLNLTFSIISIYVSLLAAIFYGDVFRKVVEIHKNQNNHTNSTED